MPHLTKIATCCYCGTRAALVLKGRERHELACSGCGAPLHNLKMMPRPAEPERKARPYVAPRPSSDRPAATRPLDKRDHPSSKSKKPYRSRKKKKKSFLRRAMSEAFDVIEDIFD